MSELITWEWKFFAIAVMWGMILSIVYDGLRIFRRVIIHRKVAWLAVEDILFWMICGFAMFHVIFMVNDGIIRSFALIAFGLGSVMYQYTVSYYIVKYISKMLIILKRMSIKIALKIVINPLKKLCKSFTIRINKSKFQKKEKRRLKKVGNQSDEKIRDKEEQRIKNKKTKAL